LTPIESHKVILIDSNFLVAAISDESNKDARDRIDFFLSNLQKNKSKLIIPTPAVAEFLVVVDAARFDFIKLLQGKSYIQTASFDMAAAYQCAMLDSSAFASGDKRAGVDKTWQEIKFDRQIVAIGKVWNATLVISGDKGVRNNAARLNIEAITVDELPLPPQAELPI